MKALKLNRWEQDGKAWWNSLAEVERNLVMEQAAKKLGKPNVSVAPVWRVFNPTRKEAVRGNENDLARNRPARN